MARIRTIKPDFFKNEQLADLPIIVRLLFIGLWTQSDRDGKLEDRPKRLKAEIFPYDNIDIDKALDQLQAAGLIFRYKVNVNASGRVLAPEQPDKQVGFIKILTFKKHQQPNVKEAKSVIPDPDFTHHCESTVLVQCQHGASTTGKEGKGKEQERKGKEGGHAQVQSLSHSENDSVNDLIFSKKEKKEIPPVPDPPPCAEVPDGQFFRDEQLEGSILRFFGFSEVSNFDKARTVNEFCRALNSSGTLDYFRTQFDAYADLKGASSAYKHSFRNFLGDQSKRFEDGAWNAENWTMRLQEERARDQGKKQLQPTRGVEAALKFANVKMRE